MKEKILVIQTAFLGDAILTLPLIQYLKKKNPNRLIDILCIPTTSEIFLHSKFINEVIVYDKKSKRIAAFLEIIKKIKNNNYDYIYSPHRSFRTALIVFFSKVKETIGFNTASFKFVYKKKIMYNTEIHEVARNLSLANFDFQNEDWQILPELYIPQQVFDKIDELTLTHKGKIAAIAPGSVWFTKIYPKEYYIDICRYLLSKKFQIVLLGSKDDAAVCNEITNVFKDNCVSLAGKLSIIESIGFLKKCSVLICNDSAPTHMAMIADIPVLTIYCSTIPQFGFFPYNRKSDYCSFDDLDCKPCGIHGHKKCPVNTFDCGFKLKPSIVIDKINSILTSEKN